MIKQLNPLLHDTADLKKDLDECIENIKKDDLLELFAVGVDKAGRFIVYSSGRISGLGIAASILQSEFAKEWNL